MRIKSRLTLLSLVFFFCLFYSGAYAQNGLSSFDLEKTISMDFQDASLKNIIKIFSIQSGLNFIASESVQDRRISLYLDKVSIKEAMDKIFKANNLTYDLDEEANIFIVKDWGKPEAETMTKVYKIKYRSVPSANLEKEKADLLGKAAGAPEAGAVGESGGVDIVTSVRQVLSKEGKITEDIRTNSLIVTDAPNRFPEIEKIIASLDVPQPQIILDVEILDVSKNVVDKMGFDWGSAASFALKVVSAGKLTSFPLSSFASEEGVSGTKFTTGSVTFPTNLSLVFDFLRKKTDTKFLARPKLLTLNNETAEISITKDEIVGREETSTVSTTGGSTTTIVYKRSTDLKLTPEGTGVFLRVTPQINPETKEITMVINPKSSTTTVSPLSSTTNQQSDVEVRTTKSIVKVMDGDTVILGGLIHNDKSTEFRKLPLLGDIPVIGSLFRSKNQEKDKERELLVFITPHIVKEGNIELAQAKKPVLLEREQSIVSGIGREEEIEEYLDSFDK